jgi:hypothetical protein
MLHGMVAYGLLMSILGVVIVGIIIALTLPNNAFLLSTNFWSSLYLYLLVKD